MAPAALLVSLAAALCGAAAANVEFEHHVKAFGRANAFHHGTEGGAKGSGALVRQPISEPESLRGYYAAAAANLSSARASAYHNLLRAYSDELIRAHPDAASENSQRYDPVEPKEHRLFQMWREQITCPGGVQPQRYGGDDDGGKWLCPINQLQSPCTIISLGSNLDTSFEEGMLELTPCKVHTFDCTVDLASVDKERHFSHKKCLGTPHTSPAGLEYVSLEEAAALTHSPHGVQLLKMDIETYEHGILAAWNEHTGGLPQQLAVEIHHHMWTTRASAADYAEGREVLLRNRGSLTLGELALLAEHMANLGYGLVHREDNPKCEFCTELLFFRVEEMVPWHGAGSGAH